MRLSLATKIFLGFVLLLGAFGLIAFLSVIEIRAVSDDLRSIKDGHLALASLAARLDTHQNNRGRTLDAVVDNADPDSRKPLLRTLPYYQDSIRTTVEDARAVVSIQTARMQARGEARSRETIEFYRGILPFLDRIVEQNEALDELSAALLKRVLAEQPLDDLLERRKPIAATLSLEIHQLKAYISKATDDAVRRAEEDEQNVVASVGLMALLALGLGILLTVLSARALAPIGRLVLYARAISRGDYEQQMELVGEDDLGLLAEELRQMARSRKDRESELDRQAAELETAYRRVAELKLYHESVVRSLRTGVIVTDRELVVTSSNRAAETHWGMAEVRGRSLVDLPLGQTLLQALGPLSARLVRAETVNAEALALGELRADVTVAPLQNDKGSVLGLVIALEDVTDAIRTKEALIRSERLAAIGRMSAHVTHEIRNPLSSIGLNAEMLLDAFRPDRRDATGLEEAQQMCRSIGREVDRLTAITDEYLRFARLPRPELAEEDVGALISTIAAFVRRDLEAAQVTLALEQGADLPPVSVDADQMRQALLNLVRNAKESMPKGGQATLGARLEGSEVALFVRDQGLGIPKESLDRIFDPFFSTKQTGTGLGLALCQQIVTEHGGHLRVRSEPGQGSEFSILLPAAKPRVAPDSYPKVGGGERGAGEAASGPPREALG